jgi:subtilisin family serine protease
VSYLLDKIVAHASFQTDTPVIGGPMSDPLKHGTHVSGIIAGDKIGVAPDASLVVCRIAPEGTTSFDRIVLALEWLCADFPSLRVINLSVGKLDDPSSALKTVVARLQQLDKILVCAIGNDKDGTARTPGNLPDAIGVGAVNSSKEVPDFSSGLTWVDSGCVRSKPDLVLPGVSIPSCIPGNRIVAASGTSQAAPMASGLIALMLQAFPNLGYLALRKKLLGLCQDLPVPPNRDGHGLPDASLIGETSTYRGS